MGDNWPENSTGAYLKLMTFHGKQNFNNILPIGSAVTTQFIPRQPCCMY